MPINAILTLTDSRGRLKRKEVETETDVLADAKANITTYIGLLAAITDLELLYVTYNRKYLDQNFAGATPSNIDVGATFRGISADGFPVVLKIPGVGDAFVGTGGLIDLTQVAIQNFLNQYLTAGDFSIANGKTVDQWLEGSLDK